MYDWSVVSVSKESVTTGSVTSGTAGSSGCEDIVGTTKAGSVMISGADTMICSPETVVTASADRVVPPPRPAAINAPSAMFADTTEFAEEDFDFFLLPSVLFPVFAFSSAFAFFSPLLPGSSVFSSVLGF